MRVVALFKLSGLGRFVHPSTLLKRLRRQGIHAVHPLGVDGVDKFLRITLENTVHEIALRVKKAGQQGVFMVKRKI